MIKSEKVFEQTITSQKDEQTIEYKSEIIRNITNNISILNEYVFILHEIDKKNSNITNFRNQVRDISNKITNTTLALRTYREYVFNFRRISEIICCSLVKFVENLMANITKNPFLIEHIGKIE